jgi:hypothetical protein
VTANAFRTRADASDVSAHQEQTRRLVRAMMALTGRTASGLARAAGLTPSTVNRFMHRPVRHTLSQRTMLALMTETFLTLKRRPQLDFDRTALAELGPAISVYENGILEHAPDVLSTIVQAKTALAADTGADAPTRSAPSELPVLLASTRDIDVQAGDFTRAPLRTSRPPFLGSDTRAFALLMPDESMMPRFDAGDMLYASPARALEGEKIDVVAERLDGGFVVGTLVSANNDTVRLATLSPRTRETLARAKLRGVYRVVGVQRLGS